VTRAKSFLGALALAVPAAALGVPSTVPLPGPVPGGERDPVVLLKINTSRVPTSLVAGKRVPVPVKVNRRVLLHVVLMRRSEGFPIVRDLHVRMNPGWSKLNLTTPVSGRYLMSFEAEGARTGVAVKVEAPKARA
jgi:hypothetical protein